MDILTYVFQALAKNPIAIVIIVFLVGMYPLGTTGLWIRKGVENQKQLNTARAEIEAQGQIVNEKWHQLNQTATLYIWGPIIGWIIAYIMIFIFTTPFQCFLSLLGLMIPAFGYFGKRFWVTGE